MPFTVQSPLGQGDWFFSIWYYALSHNENISFPTAADEPVWHTAPSVGYIKLADKRNEEWTCAIIYQSAALNK